jgi:cytochrome oxidase Cu insertion factor (SCO1/SenC/PrrC family)
MRKTFLLLIALALLSAACAPRPAQPTAAPQADPTAEPTAEPATPTQEQAAPPAQAADRPALQTVQLTNARTGDPFTLADFAGSTVLVEPMATWCTNCRSQLGNVSQAHNRLSGDFVVVALSVGENITNSDLAAYAERQGFNSFIFAIATPEMLTELTSAYGRAALTPPSTPHFIIRPDGSMSDLMTGFKNADTLGTLLNQAAGA